MIGQLQDMWVAHFANCVTLSTCRNKEVAENLGYDMNFQDFCP